MYESESLKVLNYNKKQRLAFNFLLYYSITKRYINRMEYKKKMHYSAEHTHAFLLLDGFLQFSYKKNALCVFTSLV